MPLAHLGLGLSDDTAVHNSVATPRVAFLAIRLFRASRCADVRRERMVQGSFLTIEKAPSTARFNGQRKACDVVVPAQPF